MFPTQQYAPMLRRTIGTFTAVDYLAAITKGDVLRSANGYYAGWIQKDGLIVAVTSHSAVDRRGLWFDAGSIRLVMQDYETCVELPGTAPDKATRDQCHALRTLLYATDFREGWLDWESGPTGPPSFRSIDDFVSAITPILVNA